MAIPTVTVDPATLAKIKTSLRISTNAFDTELTDLVQAAIGDLYIAGVRGDGIVLTDAIVLRAVTTYVKMNFGLPEDYDKLKASYDEQKAQLSMASGYTIWGG
jgi:hypothetical protein